MNRLALTAVACLILYKGSAITRYVDANGANPAPPFTSWAMAGTNIQDVINFAGIGDLVLVTNGIYDHGGSGHNRVLISSAMTVQSVNGPNSTTIRGFQVPGSLYGTNAVRCAQLMVPGAVVSGFTLTGGATDTNGLGGGVFCNVTNAVITNCVVVANAAHFAGGGISGGTIRNCNVLSNSASIGGGIFGGFFAATLKNCSIIGNTARDTGGGTYECSMESCFVFGNSASNVAGGCFFGAYTNCTIVENSAGQDSGGTYHNGNDLNRRLYNCIVYYNHAPMNSNCASSELATNCCISPAPTSGTSNIANEPLFIDAAGGNYRLQSNSPCIDFGNNSFIKFSSDLDGRPRVVNGTVDLGAYEFQGPNQGEFFQWLQHNGLNTDGSDDYTDPDGDGFANWNEWRAGTDPADRNSALRVLNAQPDSLGTRLTWQSVPGKSYSIERSTSVIPLTFQTVGTHVPGAASSQAYTDTTATNEGPYLYRVRVE